MSRHAILIACFLFVLHAPAQFYNWGWGPPITVTESGSSITCSVFDPILNSTRTESFSNVDQWIHDDGVVATVSASGTVGGIVYDIALADFRDEQFSFSSNTMITNSDGVISWVTGSGTVGAAIYHPYLHQWVHEQFSFSSETSIQNRDGVVSWVTGSGTVGAAVFDPGNGQWVDEQFSFSSGTLAQNRDGVVAWVTGSGTVGAAVYDPSLTQWVDEQFSFSSGTTLVLGQGVVAWRTGSGTVGSAAYDWTSNNWDDEQFDFSSSSTVPTIADGTVEWTNNNGAQQYGYTSSHQWQQGVHTAVQCEYYAEQVSGASTPHIAYLWCLTTGASTYNHQCGDGHQITRRWAWKAYANPGSYSPEFNAFSSVSNTQCTGQLTFSGTSIADVGTNERIAIAVRGSSLSLTSEFPIGSVVIFDAKGGLVYQGQHNTTTAVVSIPFADGLYTLRTGLSAVASRFVVAQ